MVTDYRPCIVIPVYNHAAPLAGLLARLQAYGLPCLLVDDGSTADCAAALQSLAAKEPWVRVIRHEVNRGKGHAVKTGLIAARAAIRCGPYTRPSRWSSGWARWR